MWTWMDAFLQGMLAGYGIAVPVGAIAILIVEMGLRNGFRSGFLAGAGAASADLVYAALAGAAGQALAVILTPYAVPLRALSGLLLVAIALNGLWKVIRQVRAEKHQAQQPAAAANRPAGRAPVYLQFLGLTLLNPLTIAYFGALILGGGVALTTLTARLLFVAGAALASLSWQSLLAGLGALAHRHLSPRFQTWTCAAGHLIVLGLGVRMLALLR
jgi:arginine exporter protein ArgO